MGHHGVLAFAMLHDKPLTRMRSACARHCQTGQAQLLSLLIVSVMVLVMFGVYSVGQLTLAKVRLQNTADAAAYSVAQTQARDYNFAAYMNRAMVANQVSAAQMVGLTSWMRSWKDTYNGKFAKLPDVLLRLGRSPLQYLWTAPAKVHKRLSNTIGGRVDRVTKPVTKVLAVLIKGLALAQKIYHYTTAFSIAQLVGMDNALVKTVSSYFDRDVDFSFDPSSNLVARNYPGASLSVLGQAGVIKGMAQWLGFTEFKVPVRPSGSTKAEDDRFAQVTVASLDPFSQKRGSNRTYFDFTPLPSLIDFTRLIPYQSGALLLLPRRLGGTELKDNKKTWAAADSGGLLGLGFIWISILGIPIPIPVPLLPAPQGFGAAQAGVAASKTQALSADNNFEKDSSDAFGGIYQDFFTSPAARISRNKGAGATIANKLAFASYLDVKDEEADNLSAPAWLLEVQAPIDDVPSSNDSTSRRYELQAKGDQLRAMAKAQAYFARPVERDDGGAELGSLYNPYWQARLVPNSFLEKYLSLLSSRLGV